MQSIPPQSTDDPSHEVPLQVAVAVFSFLSLCALCFRLYSRRLTARRLFLEDYFLIAAWVGQEGIGFLCS